MYDEVNICISSIPSRKELLKKTIQSILHQADKIYLYLNDYSTQDAIEIQSLSKSKITFIVGANSDYGDAGKFYWASRLSGYILTADDDLLYPPDYVKAVVEGIEKYHRLSVVTFHGRILKFPIGSYVSSHTKFPTFKDNLDEDLFVHIAGTGCMGWHSDTIKPMITDFPTTNMSDTYFSVLAQKKKIPICVLAHKRRWIREMISDTSITKQRIKSEDGFRLHKELVNSIGEWKLFRVEFVEEKNKSDKIADIIIPHHNRHDHLKNLLDILGNELFNVIVVSGGSFAQNCNKGAMIAETDNIVFLNDDTLPQKGDIEKLVEALKEYDIVSSTQIARGQKYYGMSLIDYKGRIEPKIDSVAGRSIFASGFCMAIKKDKWIELGGFDERFRTGHEDVDFSLRAIENGSKIGLLDLEIKHICQQSSGRMKYVRENAEMLHKIWSDEKLQKLYNGVTK